MRPGIAQDDDQLVDGDCVASSRAENHRHADHASRSWLLHHGQVHVVRAAAILASDGHIGRDIGRISLHFPPGETLALANNGGLPTPCPPARWRLAHKCRASSLAADCLPAAAGIKRRRADKRGENAVNVVCGPNVGLGQWTSRFLVLAWLVQSQQNVSGAR